MPIRDIHALRRPRRRRPDPTERFYMAPTRQTTPPGKAPKPSRSIASRLLLAILALFIGVGALGALFAGYVLIVMTPNLPPLTALTDYRPKVPLRVYTADHVLIGEFGDERRSLVRFDQVPDVMKHAVLAIEDYRFYQHGGVDFLGILRAGVADVVRGGASQGASTITMQVARNFFLSSEKTYTRKVYEMLLAYKIESALTKDQILELYMNQIYLGQRAYGFASAARVYFGKDLKDITLAQAAMLAGLPKAPSAYNPVVNPKRARIRQEYILKRMLDLSYITRGQYDQAMAENIHTRAGGAMQFSVHAEYVAEMVRQMMYAQYKEDTYTRGLNVVTTITSGDQEAGYRAVRKGIMDYERRHGYRGPEAFIDLPAVEDDREQAIEDALLDHPDNGDLVSAVVVAVSSKEVRAVRLNGETVTISGAGLRFAAPALSARAQPSQKLRAGAVVRLLADDRGNWQITQLPQVEGALVAVHPNDGALVALVGGFDFNKNKFNHVTQAWRQPGSTFKPFIYSASLEKGLSPATIINDAPLYFSAAETGGQPWEPKDDDQPEGPMTMRAALDKSKNLVSIRILNFIGTHYGQDFVARFGFDPAKNPPYLPMALGAGQVTPLQLVDGYSVFANGGYRINPYLIAEVTDANGAVLSRAEPLVAGANAPRVIDERNAFVMDSLLHDVATKGTGAPTNALHRNDLSGKTGTTNDAHDGWFAGYQRSVVAVAWLGYDQPRSLGSREFGAQLALPVWTAYMSEALKGVPQTRMDMPAGLATIDGELYFDNMTPGAGFVASIGMNDPGAGTPADGLPGASQVAPTIDSNERQQILNSFDKP
ncbi:MAG: penicillin-binding protein 1A [Janthinobacterium lividum]